MASGPLEQFLSAVMALRSAYVREKSHKKGYDPATDPTLEQLQVAIDDFREHMKTR